MRKSKSSKLSIVIPAFNEEEDLEGCLKSLANQNCGKSVFEVIIVDNHSTDNTIKIAHSFSKKLNLRIFMNSIKDAEVSKKIGFDRSRGDFFMYLDADMRFNQSNFIEKMLYPFSVDSRIAGNFVCFKVNGKHPPLTRALSYDEFQRDPIFKFFTVGVNDIIKEDKGDYFLLFCSKDKIPPQGLMIYRKNLVSDYARNQKQLIDNEIPAVLVENGHYYFAFVPSVGVEHLLLRSLSELAKKRIRNLNRTYFPNKTTRKYKWINWVNDYPKVGIWLIYTNSFFLPILSAIYKTIKYRDLCFLSEPSINLVSTYAIVAAVLIKKIGK